MKKFSSIFLLSVSLFNYSTSVKATAPYELPQTTTQLVSTTIQEKIKLIRSATTLRRGDVGLITIQGTPGVAYTIISSYKVGTQTIPVKQLRTGDSSGFATFSWVVGEDTVTGTYPVTIKGDGEVLNLTHTVLP